MMKFLFFFICIIAGCFSFSKKDSLVVNQTPIQIIKHPCLGKCTTYVIIIDSTFQIHFDGEFANEKNYRTAKKMLSKNEIDFVSQKIAAIKKIPLAPTYGNVIFDFPYITFRMNPYTSKEETSLYVGEGPVEIYELVAYLEKMFAI